MRSTHQTFNSRLQVRLLPCRLLVLAVLSIAAVPAIAQEGLPPSPKALFPARELIVGTKEAPPFAMKDQDGAWTGIAIDLWRQVAQKLGVKFRLVEEPTVQSLIDATSRGDYDLSVAAITISAE